MPKMKKRSGTSRILNLSPGDTYARATTRDCRRYVIGKTPFVAGKSSQSNSGDPTLYGRWEWGTGDVHDTYQPEGGCPRRPVRYVVYSYGTHFPMYIWDEVTHRWYGNSDKYSRTTTRHQHNANPTFFNPDIPSRAIQWLDTDKMRAIARYGVFATVCHAAGGNAFDSQD